MKAFRNRILCAVFLVAGSSFLASASASANDLHRLLAATIEDVKKSPVTGYLGLSQSELLTWLRAHPNLDINESDPELGTALEIAVVNLRLDWISIIGRVSGFNINAFNQAGFTALHVAILAYRNADAEHRPTLLAIVFQLIFAGANTTMATPTQPSPTEYAHHLDLDDLVLEMIQAVQTKEDEPRRAQQEREEAQRLAKEEAERLAKAAEERKRSGIAPRPHIPTLTLETVNDQNWAESFDEVDGEIALTPRRDGTLEVQADEDGEPTDEDWDAWDKELTVAPAEAVAPAPANTNANPNVNANPNIIVNVNATATVGNASRAAVLPTISVSSY